MKKRFRASLKTRSFSLRTKIALAMATVAALVVAATLGTNFYFRRAQLLAEFQTFVRGVAGTTALALNGDEIATVRTMQDEPSAAFQNARKLLERAREINGLAQHELYLLRPLGEVERVETEFVVMLQPTTFIGDRYTVPSTTRAQFLRAWNERTPTSTGIYRDENGHWITGYAPILDSSGQPVAIIEADAEVSRFLAKQRVEIFLALGIGAGVFCVAMIPGLLLAAGVSRGLNQLSAGMYRFRTGDHGTQVEVKTGDEVEELSIVFNTMMVAVSERLALLSYVSRFTAEAVRRSRDDPAWLSGSERKITVLFADLRGFTKWCENRDARLLVYELNHLLAIQADIVISSGGDVDKFIGDAVMAVFLDDDGPSRRIYDCARALIARIQIEVAREKWPLSLGLGIHRGSAVVGSIGSATRRDFTAVGHTVNLASRLCDRADPWEMLISEDFYERLPLEVQFVFEETTPMQFKNVQGAVRTYRCVAPSEEERA